MPNRPLGVSFAPTFENAQQQGREGGSSAAPQGSIQTLNFRLPQVTGAASRNALSPLQSDTPQATFGGAVLRSVLQTVLGPEEVMSYMGDVSGGGGGRDTGFNVLAGLAGAGQGAAPGAGAAPAPPFNQGIMTGATPPPTIRPGEEGTRTGVTGPTPGIDPGALGSFTPPAVPQAPNFGGGKGTTGPLDYFDTQSYY